MSECDSWRVEERGEATARGGSRRGTPGPLVEAPSPATNTRWRDRRLPWRSAERKPAFGRSRRLRSWLGVVVVLRVLLVLLARTVMMMVVVVVNRGRPQRLRRNH